MKTALMMALLSLMLGTVEAGASTDLFIVQNKYQVRTSRTIGKGHALSSKWKKLRAWNINQTCHQARFECEVTSHHTCQTLHSGITGLVTKAKWTSYAAVCQAQPVQAKHARVASN